MSNTINVNYMTSMVNRYSKTFSQKISNESMSEKIADAGVLQSVACYQ